MPESLGWDHVYILGWVDAYGKSRLTSWSEGDPPPIWINVVVTGTDDSTRRGMPVWSAPVPPGAKILPMPEHLKTRQEFITYAASQGGLYAFGWYLPGENIDRTPITKG